MNKNKMTMILLTVLLLCLALAGCGGKKDEDKETSSAETQSSAETTSAPEATTGAQDETTAGAQNETTEGAGSTAGSGLTEIRDAVAAAYGENYLPEMPLDAETLETLYGITPDMYEEALGEVPMISAQVDTLIIVQAKEGRSDDVKAALENYRTTQLEEGMNYPMNVPKIEASEVVVYGDYVCYVMLGVIDNAIENEDEMLAAHKEQNEIAKGVLQEKLGQ